MKKNFLIFLSLVSFIIISNVYSIDTLSLQQRFVINRNDGTVGGVLSITYQVKGTNLQADRTLGSLTCDLIYDTTIIQFNNSTNWNANTSVGNGYTRFAQSNPYPGLPLGANKALRIGILGTNVNINGGGDPPGYDLLSDYDNIVTLNYTILNNTVNAVMYVFLPTNQIGLYTNPHNEPANWVITNRPLSTPIGIDAPLPVSLASFTSAVFKNTVNLNWKTALEVNNKEFRIERKVNTNSEWSQIATVQGKGNSDVPVEYSYSDKNLQTGKYSYRLKQIDNNGNFEYFSLSSDVIVGVPTKFDLSQNYPNPFNPTTKINFDLPKDAKVSMKLYDMLGREVATLLNEFRTAGYYTVDFNAANLSSGIYFYRISAGSYNAVKKLVLIK